MASAKTPPPAGTPKAGTPKAGTPPMALRPRVPRLDPASRHAVRLAREADRRRRLAQIAGAGAIAALGQFAVDMPDGYFGAADHMTPLGLAFMLLQALLVIAAGWSAVRGEQLAPALPPLMLSLNIGVFVPPIGSDPVIAGGLVLWQAALLGRLLFPGRPAPLRPIAGDPLSKWLTLNGPAVRHALVVSLLASVAVVGYRLGERFPAQVVCLLLDAAAVALSLPFLRLLARAGARWRLAIAGTFLTLALLSAGRPVTALTLLAVYQALVLVQLVVHMPTFPQLVELFLSRPPVLIAGSFLLLIALGTLLLSFPAAAAPGRVIAPLDALFTATSAACVTGLIVLDTPVDFSRFGQLVILCLIQAGGLNIMVLSSFATLLLGRGLSLRGEKALGELLDLTPERSVYPLLRFIVLATLAFEAAGAAVLALGYGLRGEPALEAVWKGVFHAVSAFCNAGFSLHSDSLIGFQDSPMMLATVAGLIVVGGLGFVVLAAGWTRLRSNRRRSTLATQVKLVLLISGLLIAAGTVWYAAGEWHRSLAGLAPWQKVLNALFQSVTLRTAGFNSVDFSALQGATVLMMLVFMFIGASPGGTGGGIKTTTAAVLLSAIPAIARGHHRVVMFNRTLPLETVYRGTAIAVISAGIAFGATALLLATQPLDFLTIVFEVVSAVATVGLSLGATPQLDPLGRLVIILVMFLGRIGPLTFALLLGRHESSRVRYPEARVMVG